MTPPPEILSGPLRLYPSPETRALTQWPEDGRTRFGGANAWAGLAVDTGRGLLFAPLGSPSDDFIGIHRPGANLYGNSLVALDAASGKLRWHYQVVHHDLWDRDLNAAPTLVQVERNGKQIDAVAQTTKQGYVFVFDRESGEPLFPIEERPVPASTIPGEDAWPTQPVPLRPPAFARQKLEESELTRITPEAHAHVLKQFREFLPTRDYAPFGPEPRLLMPGLDGGATWGGPAYDPSSGVLIVNSMDRPAIGQVSQVPGGSTPANLLYQGVCASCHMLDMQGTEHGVPGLLDLRSRFSRKELEAVIREGHGRMVGIPLPDLMMEMLVDHLLMESNQVSEGVSTPNTEEKNQQFAFMGYRRFVDHEGYPAIAPPWGTLTAIDLNAGELLWQSTLGEHAELSQRGIPKTGTLNYGGPVITATGLIFIAATMDNRIRAFDLETGEELWQARLPAPAYATPAVYAVDGRQYIAVACGGGKLGSPSSDVYMAFRLPR